MEDVIVGRHFESMKDGAIEGNISHYDCEIKIDDLEAQAASMRTIRPDNEEFLMPDGLAHLPPRPRPLGQPRCRRGDPSEVMDMFSRTSSFLSFAMQDGASMDKEVYDITTEQDQNLATTKLGTLGFAIDKLTDAQLAYLDDYTVGT